MDERSDPRTPPDLERVRAAGFDDGAFRRIPVLPMVALVTLFLGLFVGYGLAPAAAPEPTMSPALAPTFTATPRPTATPTAMAVNSASFEVVTTPAPTPTPSPSPSEYVALTAPPGGISLTKAVTVVKSRYALKDSQILGATLVDDRVIPSGAQQYRWAWVVWVSGNVGPCSIEALEGSPASTDLCFGSTSAILVDFYTAKILT